MAFDPKGAAVARGWSGIYVARSNTKKYDKDMGEAERAGRKEFEAAGLFAARIPSYDGLPGKWRSAVEKAYGVLLGGCVPDGPGSEREWRTKFGDREMVHTMRVFRSPEGVSWIDALGNMALRSGEALRILGVERAAAASVCEHLVSLTGRIRAEAESFLGKAGALDAARQRLLAAGDGKGVEAHDAAVKESLKTIREMGTEALSKMSYAIQYPLVVDPSVSDPYEKLRSDIASPKFPDLLKEASGAGAVMAHVFGVSPVDIRCADRFEYATNADGTNRVDVRFSWDFRMNAAPLLDALTDEFSKGLFGGRMRGMLKATAAPRTKEGGVVGGRNRMRDISETVLTVPLPADTKNGKMFVATLRAMLSPYLNMSVRPAGLEKELEVMALPESVKSEIKEFRSRVEKASNVYALEAENLRAMKEKTAASREMDIHTRIVPYPDKQLVFVLVRGDGDKENGMQGIRAAVSEFASQNGLGTTGWEYYRKKPNNYFKTYLKDDGGVGLLADYLSRTKTAAELGMFLSERGFDVPVERPVAMSFEVRAAAFEKDQMWVALVLPAAMDRKTAKAVKKHGGEDVAPEAMFLAKVEELLREKIDDSDEGEFAERIEDTLGTLADGRRAYAVNATRIKNDRAALELLVGEMKSFFENEVLAPIHEEYPDVPVDVKVRFVADERQAKSEHDVRERMRGWTDKFFRDGVAPSEKESRYERMEVEPSEHDEPSSDDAPPSGFCDISF